MKHLAYFDSDGSNPSGRESSPLPIVELARKGDLDAQAQLVRLYQKRVRGFVTMKMGVGNHAVEDVCQVTLIKMFRSIHHLRDASCFESWLFNLARNACLDHWRRSQRGLITGELPVGPGEPFEPAKTIAFERDEAIEIALSRLNTTEQDILRRAATGASLIELSAFLGVSVQTTKTRLRRARCKLREKHRALDAA
jgi:RNA polymerase sigma-70 factor (ECF subfamily)